MGIDKHQSFRLGARWELSLEINQSWLKCIHGSNYGISTKMRYMSNVLSIEDMNTRASNLQSKQCHFGLSTLPPLMLHFASSSLYFPLHSTWTNNKEATTFSTFIPKAHLLIAFVQHYGIMGPLPQELVRQLRLWQMMSTIRRSII